MSGRVAHAMSEYNSRDMVTTIVPHIEAYLCQTSDMGATLVLLTDVGSTSADIPPSIVIPPSDTKVVQGPGAAAKLECVANAR